MIVPIKRYDYTWKMQDVLKITHLYNTKMYLHMFSDIYNHIHVFGARVAVLP